MLITCSLIKFCHVIIAIAYLYFLMYIKRINWLTVYGLILLGAYKRAKIGCFVIILVEFRILKGHFILFTAYMTELINVTLLNNINL